MLRIVGGRPGRRRLLVSYFLAASLRCQARIVAGVTGKTSAQRRRGMNCVRPANQGPVSWLVPHPADIAAQHRVLVPEDEQLSILRQVAAECQDGQTQYPAN